jgi:hypothetical protein
MKTHPPSHQITTFPCSRRDCTRVLAIALAVMPVSRAQMFAAPGDAPPPGAIAAARAKKVAGEIRTFTLRLNYAGQEDKPFYRLLLSVPAIVGKDRDNPFHRQAQITEAQAGKIVGFLAKDGFFDTALDGNRNLGPVPPKEPYYALTVGIANGGNPIVFEEWLTFRPLLIHRLDGLRKLLDGEAATGMDFLITRLSGYRRLLDK